MRLRQLTAQDVDAVTRLDQLCFPPAVAFPRQTFAECIASPHCLALGIENFNQILAFAILHFPGPRSANLITIDVHPRHRRRGLATLLMEQLEQKCRERGVRRIHLQVATHNAPALALYQKWNYVLRATLPDYYGPGIPAHLMDKNLSAGKTPLRATHL